MGYSVIISHSAERDRDHIVVYLLDEFKSTQAATHFMDEFDKVLLSLSETPESYPASRDRRLKKLGYRKALFMDYVALFEIDGDVVKLARIFHASQDYARLV